ncbi:MAG: hypothetical protein DYG89_03220 [Caldilinea sp. CFX5]|nr:hypothetical protein [Caldilinea sp. CFX5]
MHATRNFGRGKFYHSQLSYRLRRKYQNQFVQLSVIILLINLASGCISPRTPFSYPNYPVTVQFVNAVEGYQSNIANEQYDMWNMNNVTRYALQHLRIHEHYLYAAQCGLTIFDISQPERIAVLGTYSDKCGVDDLVVVDGKAYLAARDRGIVVIDVRNPKAPKRIGSYEYNAGANSQPMSLVVQEGYIYLYTPSPKLQNDKIKTETNTILSPEQPWWQVLQVQNDNNVFRLQHIQTIFGLGRPKAAFANYVYAFSQWRNNKMSGKIHLQTIEIGKNGLPELVNDQTIDNKIYDMKIYGNMLFLSIGAGVRVWDISVPTQPKEINSTYNTYGAIGDYATIDVDGTKILGEGYSLKYQRISDSVKLTLFAESDFPEQVISCQTLGKPKAQCQLQSIGQTRRGVNTGFGSVLNGNYLFYSYPIATMENDEKGFTLIDLAILIYQFP